MKIRCQNCFRLFEDIDDMCPYCGYSAGEKAEESCLLQPGTRLKERYLVGEKIGQGGFGIVYKAWDTNLERIVAIKEFFPASMVTRSEGRKEVAVFSSKREHEYEKYFRKFRHEAKIMSLLTGSLNCIQTYDVFEENGTAYIVMEYVDAPTLREYIRERKEKMLPEREAVEIITQVLSGVSEIHAKGIYHLDIAVDNIFIKRGEDSPASMDVRLSPAVLIYDYGAARMEKEIRKRFKEEEEIILKPGFAPPEQYNKNEKIGPWTDIYAVGANLYYLLTGVVPVESTDREQEDVLEKPEKLAAVSHGVNNVVLRAMALAPELRYKSAKEFSKELKNEKAKSWEEELKRRKRIRNRFIALVSSVLVLAAAAICFLWYTKGTIYEDEITVWVAANGDAEAERGRYEAVLKSFSVHYPQIDVKLEVIDSAELEEKFLATPDQNKPDLIETTDASQMLLEKCKSLSLLLYENKRDFVDSLEGEIVTKEKKQFPLGMYVSILYKQSGTEIAELAGVTPFEFIKEAAGYTESDTTLYSMVQENLAGRYELMPGERKEIYLTDKFSVFSRSRNKEKAAKALLSYMLTDVGQERLHITYRSDYLPVSESMFQVYVREVFSELEFLSETLDGYRLK